MRQMGMMMLNMLDSMKLRKVPPAPGLGLVVPLGASQAVGGMPSSLALGLLRAVPWGTGGEAASGTVSRVTP